MTGFVKATLKALLAAILAATVLVFIFAFCAYISEDPAPLLGVYGMAAFLISSFIGGIVSRKNKGNILNSLALGVIYGSVVLAFTLLLSEGESIPGKIILCIGGIASSVLGGILFGGRVKKPRLYRKKRPRVHRGKRRNAGQ